jgi:hypothetical protein
LQKKSETFLTEGNFNDVVQLAINKMRSEGAFNIDVTAEAIVPSESGENYHVIAHLRITESEAPIPN